MHPKVVVSLLYAISTYEKRQLKNSHNLKVESYAYSVGLFRTSSPGGGIPSSPDRTALRRLGEEAGHIGVCNKAGRCSEHQRLLQIS